ncbi:hypothetical protein C8Q79DRAFT_1015011 [Trametes meyenii]|nr:hypothetical protein C8Q79DRAFT_1015011 [Trametes meyenii]
MLTPRPAFSSAGSMATLDLQDVLTSCPGENLLSTSLSFISTLESSHSFDNVPPFPTTSKPLIFFNDLGLSLFRSPPHSAVASSDIARPLLTSPTGPRMKVMITEQVSVGAWIHSISPPGVPFHPADEAKEEAEPISESPSWVPEGSLFSPKKFSALFRRFDNASSRRDSVLANDQDAANANADLTLVDTAGAVSPRSSGSNSSVDLVKTVNTPLAVLVPTIMVSNSSVALPLSLESSHSLHCELPLAVRRGKKLPPALSLCRKPDPDSSSDPYPDIPTPFLGSPTACSPTTISTQEPPTFAMGLGAMCADLRSRLPPPPFTPTESKPDRRSIIGLSSQDSAQSSIDEDEWAFAKDLVGEWRSCNSILAEVSPPPSPAGELPYASTPDSPTFTCTTLPDSSGDNAPAAQGIQTPTDVKLTRRKTVIIQAPEPCPPKTEETFGGESGISLLPSDFDEPVPFETPADDAVRTSMNGDHRISFAPSSRPASTASTRPVRGILKEKKSVRFSTVDMFHEYTARDNLSGPQHPDGGTTAPQDSAASQTQPRLQPQPESPFRARRTTVTAAVHKSSPLRQSCAPTQLAAAELPSDRHRVVRPLADPTSFAGGSMAKHPAVRAMARASSSRREGAGDGPPYAHVGSGVGGAVVGAPGLKSPTLQLPKDERRAPLRSINAHLSLPAQRRPVSDVLAAVAATPTRRRLLPREKGKENENVAGAQKLGETLDKKTKEGHNVPAAIARRVLRTASIPPAARHERDENVQRRSQAVGRETSDGVPSVSAKLASAGAGNGSRSRMSAPLRSIFTKLRT